MTEVACIVRLALDRPDLTLEYRTYAELFETGLGVDIFDSSPGQLRALALQHGVQGVEGMELGCDGWLDLLLSHLIQPGLGRDRLCFVRDYPATQAALARLNADGRTAARFELFYSGIELANGFHELVDPEEQAAAFRVGKLPAPLAGPAAGQGGSTAAGGDAAWTARLLRCRGGARPSADAAPGQE